MFLKVETAEGNGDEVLRESVIEKALGKKLRPLKEKRKHQLEALGFSVYVIDGLEQIGGVLHGIQTT